MTMITILLTVASLFLHHYVYSQVLPSMSNIPMRGMQVMAPTGMAGMAGLSLMPGMIPSMTLAQPKLPVVVMPYYSKQKTQTTKRHKRKRKPMKLSDSSSSDISYDSSDTFEFSKSLNSQRKQVLTPVVSYVTKDGYVVYQEKIKRKRAKDWLLTGKSAKPDDISNSLEVWKEELLNDDELWNKESIDKSNRKINKNRNFS